ncbi:rhodanese-like domain-containing protein [Akkermansiaceae bacterium]|nr:rhodanese-like domain-containing protein [Akkermansiaceae bacterium]MDA7886787.1 rhodanese-like domain-containing protein [bacterium]MDA7891297.1 rhodanese-like domain-containing protein [Akkermansiaceae bacterium]MDA7929366.1 rhodanese-like domain-containing protein [Akkermansiaceae bacterium]MDA9830637.1 rhodanese-like domain-containing protein [Akkermansiaceae bacterium]
MPSPSSSILPADLRSLFPTGCSLVDVREPVEHAEDHIDGAKLIPLSQLEKRIGEIDRNAPVVVMCRSGKRGMEALKKLESLGVEEVLNLKGGILAWKAAGLPVGKGENKVFPLMQQVQIAIGIGVLVGVALSKTVDSKFIYLSAFFGAGLLFAGTTGWCGMAILMSKMPWNRIDDCSSCTSGNGSNSQ